MVESILLQIAANTAEPATGFNTKTLLLYAAIAVVIFFFMILPQRKKSKEAKKFRESLVPGLKVVTAGGLHGKIKESQESIVVLEISDGVRIKIEKSSIVSAISEGGTN